jgi:hypothetical protein
MDRDLVARHLQMDYPEGEPFENEGGVGVVIGSSRERIVEMVIYDGSTKPGHLNEGRLDIEVLKGELSVYVAANPSYVGAGEKVTIEPRRHYSVTGRPEGTLVMRTLYLGTEASVEA